MEKKKYLTHLFVCTSCGKEITDETGQQTTEGMKIANELKSWIKSNCNQKCEKVRISKSTCLKECDNPIAAVLYPQNEWYLNLDKDSVISLKERLIKIVETK
jgi:predicted metal-binding protein